MKVDRHQSVEMSCGIKLATALVVFVVFANAVKSPFPRDRSLVYSYYGDVKAGTIEPAAYASQYAISGYFNIKPDNSDPQYPNAFVVGLRNVKTGLHNGLAAHYERTKVFSPLPEPAKFLEDPFLIVYNDEGQLTGVKISTDEPGWSKNMKLAIASMLQLDLPSMKLESPIKHQSFMSKENTIHGDCWTSYDVHAESSDVDKESNEFIITKFGSPRNCTNYNVFTFTDAELESCDLPPEKPVNMASRRVFQAEKKGKDILIKTLIAHGGVNYFPLRGRSEAHYVLNNATFILLEDESVDLPVVDFSKLPLITDMSYQRPQGNYADKAGTDITQGRHSVDQNSLIQKVKEMLGEAADYLEENHLEAKEPDSKRGHTINRILHEMSFMERSSFRQVFNEIKSTQNSRDEVIKNIFLEVVPLVGTHASSFFIADLVINDEVDRLSTIQMLAKFPLNVRNPTEEFLVDFDNLLPMTTFPNAYSAIIPAYASLVFRNFKNTPKPEENRPMPLYISALYNTLIEGDYHEKVSALAALKNIPTSKAFDDLAPLIRGEVEIRNLEGNEPTKLRLHAIWAVEKSIPNYQAAHDLLWPIMADSNLPLKLRIAAYDILIRQAPSMTNVLHIYWFMVYEKNEHLYNYHYTTIKGLANSVDPCNMHLTELATKIMRFTRIHSPVSYALSGSYMVDAVDEVYGHGDQFAVSYTANEKTGFPEVVNLEYSAIEGRKRITVWKIQLISDSIGGVGQGVPSLLLNLGVVFSLEYPSISNEDVKRILQEASGSMESGKISIDAVISYKGRAVSASSYTSRDVHQLLSDLQLFMKFKERQRMIGVSRQFVSYDALYEQHVISEMGLPILMERKIPMVTSLKGEFKKEPADRMSKFHKNIDYREWRHGDYAMSIYNPLLDVWHTIRRSTATDVQLPVESITGVTEGSTLEAITPILPITKYSRQGMVTHAKDCTTVSEDDNGTLKTACPTCEYQEVVTRGISSKKNHQTAYDVKDIGLQYSREVFDCETDLTPTLINKNLFRSFYKERKNSWGHEIITDILALRQSWKNLINSPRMGSCGVMYKIEPSMKYPTSHVQTVLKVHAEKGDQNSGVLHMLEEFKLNIRGKLKAFDATTNETTRSWRIDVDVDMNREHRLNTMSAQLTRTTPGEKNLMICIDAQKSYPSLPEDPLKVGVTKEETHSKLTFSMAETDDAECSRDQTLITIGVKGELSEDQKKWFMQESISGACKADMDNPLYNTAENFVPRTVNCLDHAIRYTTLRKYTINVAHAKVPEYISSAFHAYEDEIKALFYPHLVYTTEHTEPGTMRMIVKFPMKLNNVNVSVATPDHGWGVIGAEVSDDSWTATERDPPRHEGFGPDPDKHLWISPLDNSRFPIRFLRDYTDDELKLCSLYPKVILTTDGGEIPYILPEEWTLVSGDIVDKSWAIFAKNVNNVMGLKLFVRKDVVEFPPNDSSLIINGEEFSLSKMINGTCAPVEDIDTLFWSLKLTSYGGVHAIQIKDTPVTVIHSLNGVTLMIDTTLQGKIAGLCGRMDGTHKTKLPKVYRLP